jgi:predicted membrane chloride channel (bestrophin family)
MKQSRLAKMILLFILIAPIAIFIFGSIVMLLWNNVLTPVLHVSTVTFWQALGILVLAKILFSSFGGRGRYRRDYWKQRMMWSNMTPEQREKLKEEWKNRNYRWEYKPSQSETGEDQVNPQP